MYRGRTLHLSEGHGYSGGVLRQGWCCFVENSGLGRCCYCGHDLMKNGAAGGSEVVRVQPASAGSVVGLTAGEKIALELGFYSRQTDVCLGRHSRNDSFLEQDLDFHTTFVAA